jgi:ABC-type glycerol-3-phosphate transport system substrate-binding protein
MLDNNSYWISSQTKHPDEAWLCIDWMTRPDGFYGREYVSRGMGFLQYVDNTRYVTDPNILRIIEISRNLRVVSPEPLILKPELAKSQAFNVASIGILPMVGETLLSGGDFRAVARDMAQTQNDLFLKTLAEERKSGLNVGVEDYTFPGWNFDEDFDYGSYQKSGD